MTASGDSTTPDRLRGLIYNLLVRTAQRRDAVPFRWFWKPLYDIAKNGQRPIETVIHERVVRINFGYTYPLYARIFPSLNNPLLELVYQSFRGNGRPVTVIDIGAAVGDTALLIESNCPRMVASYICIDGDPEFFSYLTHNLSFLPRCRCLLQQLSGSKGEARALIHTHAGTASAQGENKVPVAPLDDVLADHSSGPIDVIKIDVDGFDGEVLAGATSILRKHRPAVIFEWHPQLCSQTGNNDLHHFSALSAAGYEQLVWFTKTGEFSHFGRSSDTVNIERLRHFALQSKTDPDTHFDVIALSSGSMIDEVALADLQFARQRRSAC
jgi:FkbM family methyltransferase